MRIVFSRPALIPAVLVVALFVNTSVQLLEDYNGIEHYFFTENCGEKIGFGDGAVLRYDNDSFSKDSYHVRNETFDCHMTWYNKKHDDSDASHFISVQFRPGYHSLLDAWDCGKRPKAFNDRYACEQFGVYVSIYDVEDLYADSVPIATFCGLIPPNIIVETNKTFITVRLHVGVPDEDEFTTEFDPSTTDVSFEPSIGESSFPPRSIEGDLVDERRATSDAGLTIYTDGLLVESTYPPDMSTDLSSFGTTDGYDELPPITNVFRQRVYTVRAEDTAVSFVNLPKNYPSKFKRMPYDKHTCGVNITIDLTSYFYGGCKDDGVRNDYRQFECRDRNKCLHEVLVCDQYDSPNCWGYDDQTYCCGYGGGHGGWVWNKFKLEWLERGGVKDETAEEANSTTVNSTAAIATPVMCTEAPTTATVPTTMTTEPPTTTTEPPTTTTAPPTTTTEPPTTSTEPPTTTTELITTTSEIISTTTEFILGYGALGGDAPVSGAMICLLNPDSLKALGLLWLWVILGILAFLLLACIIYCCCKKRRSRREELDECVDVYPNPVGYLGSTLLVVGKGKKGLVTIQGNATVKEELRMCHVDKNGELIVKDTAKKWKAPLIAAGFLSGIHRNERNLIKKKGEKSTLGEGAVGGLVGRSKVVNREIDGKDIITEEVMEVDQGAVAGATTTTTTKSKSKARAAFLAANFIAGLKRNEGQVGQEENTGAGEQTGPRDPGAGSVGWKKFIKKVAQHGEEPENFDGGAVITTTTSEATAGGAQGQRMKQEGGKVITTTTTNEMVTGAASDAHIGQHAGDGGQVSTTQTSKTVTQTGPGKAGKRKAIVAVIAANFLAGLKRNEQQIKEGDQPENVDAELSTTAKDKGPGALNFKKVVRKMQDKPVSECMPAASSETNIHSATTAVIVSETQGRVSRPKPGDPEKSGNHSAIVTKTAIGGVDGTPRRDPHKKTQGGKTTTVTESSQDGGQVLGPDGNRKAGKSITTTTTTTTEEADDESRDKPKKSRKGGQKTTTVTVTEDDDQNLPDHSHTGGDPQKKRTGKTVVTTTTSEGSPVGGNVMDSATRKHGAAVVPGNVGKLSSGKPQGGPNGNIRSAAGDDRTTTKKTVYGKDGPTSLITTTSEEFLIGPDGTPLPKGSSGGTTKSTVISEKFVGDNSGKQSFPDYPESQSGLQALAPSAVGSSAITTVISETQPGKSGEYSRGSGRPGRKNNRVITTTEASEDEENPSGKHGSKKIQKGGMTTITTTTTESEDGYITGSDSTQGNIKAMKGENASHQQGSKKIQKGGMTTITTITTRGGDGDMTGLDSKQGNLKAMEGGKPVVTITTSDYDDTDNSHGDYKIRTGTTAQKRNTRTTKTTESGDSVAVHGGAVRSEAVMSSGAAAVVSGGTGGGTGTVTRSLHGTANRTESSGGGKLSWKETMSKKKAEYPQGHSGQELGESGQPNWLRGAVGSGNASGQSSTSRKVVANIATSEVPNWLAGSGDGEEDNEKMSMEGQVARARTTNVAKSGGGYMPSVQEQAQGDSIKTRKMRVAGHAANFIAGLKRNEGQVKKSTSDRAASGDGASSASSSSISFDKAHTGQVGRRMVVETSGSFQGGQYSGFEAAPRAHTEGIAEAAGRRALIRKTTDETMPGFNERVLSSGTAPMRHMITDPDLVNGARPGFKAKPAFGSSGTETDLALDAIETKRKAASLAPPQRKRVVSAVEPRFRGEAGLDVPVPEAKPTKGRRAANAK